jgi:hypothetical protein
VGQQLTNRFRPCLLFQPAAQAPFASSLGWALSKSNAESKNVQQELHVILLNERAPVVLVRIACDSPVFREDLRKLNFELAQHLPTPDSDRDHRSLRRDQ